jgi:hypothetical protein
VYERPPLLLLLLLLLGSRQERKIFVMGSIKSVIAVGAVTALMVPVAVVPALAEDNDGQFDNDRYDGIGASWIEERAEHIEDFYDEVYGIDLDLDDDSGWYEDGYYDDGWYDDGFFFVGEGFEDFEQEEAESVEQEAESGDVEQSFEVTGSGDSSNQTVGTQGVANTGNAQNAIGVIDDGDLIGDFDDDRVFVDDEGYFDHGFFRDFDGDGDVQFEEVGSTIELSPTQTVTSDQQVNQAASASGR